MEINQASESDLSESEDEGRKAPSKYEKGSEAKQARVDNGKEDEVGSITSAMLASSRRIAALAAREFRTSVPSLLVPLTFVSIGHRLHRR